MTQQVQWTSGVDLFGDGSRQGSITKFVEQNPHSLVICNEFEKAHRKVLEAVLPVLDQGFLPSSTGRVDFRETVFIFTTNLGSELWNRPAAPEEGTLASDEALQALRQLVFVGLRVCDDGNRVQWLRHEPGLHEKWLVLVGQRVTGFGTRQTSDGHDVAGDGFGDSALSLANRAREGADLFVDVVVFVTGCHGEVA